MTFEVSVDGATGIPINSGDTHVYNLDKATASMPFDITLTAIPSSGTAQELFEDCGF